LNPLMLEERDLKLDLLALGLLAVTIFLAASLFSYDPADPPTNLVFPRHVEISNICGRVGAIVAAGLFAAFGLGAYYLVVSLAIFTAVLVSGKNAGQPALRLAGWLLSLASFSTLAAMALPCFSPGPVIGSGGYLGAAGRGLLEMNFANVGGYLMVTSAVLVGLLLSTDYMLLRFALSATRVSAKGLGAGTGRLRKVCTPKSRRRAAQPKEAAREEVAQQAAESENRQTQDKPAEQPVPESSQENSSVRVVGPPKAEPANGNPVAEKAGGDHPSRRTDPPSRPSPLAIRKPKKSRREELIEEIEAESTSREATDYELPSLDLLLQTEPFCFEEHEKEVRRKAAVLEKTFADFNLNVRVVEIQTGPVIAQFEVALEAGLRLSRITGLADDLAIALKVPSVRIVAPIPGKNTVALEVPNSERKVVRLREVIEETNGLAHTMRIPIYLGKNVAGDPMVIDLASMPHLLIAGRTGTGKSVCLNSIIVSILMTRRPEDVRTILIDPKMVELSPYKKIPHLMHPVVTDMRKAEAILAWAVEKMDERYQFLARAGVRHLSVYNQLGEEELKERIDPESEEEWAQIPRHLPYIVIVADEMADLMMTAAKEVEGHIIRLAQKSRAVGIHLVLATQKPTVDVITGLIKSNLPARIAFEVASRTDSRVVLDEMGADKLLGDGDMLFLRPGTSSLIRGQGTYLSDDEIAAVIDAVATNEPQFVKELVQLKSEDASSDAPDLATRDELYRGAVDVVVREGRGSVSLLQRVLGIGYGRAARLIDYMEEDGIVGPYNGSQAREILISVEDWEAMSGQDHEERSDPPPQRPANKILFNPAPDVRETLQVASRPPSAPTNTALANATGANTISYKPHEPPDEQPVEEDQLPPWQDEPVDEEDFGDTEER
jgi:S-DNA-T family DNA segregation ATPase FtsK/SpoIIIE